METCLPCWVKGSVNAITSSWLSYSQICDLLIFCLLLLSIIENGHPSVICGLSMFHTFYQILLHTFEALFIKCMKKFRVPHLLMNGPHYHYKWTLSPGRIRRVFESYLFCLTLVVPLHCAWAFSSCSGALWSRGMGFSFQCLLLFVEASLLYTRAQQLEACRL